MIHTIIPAHPTSPYSIHTHRSRCLPTSPRPCALGALSRRRKGRRPSTLSFKCAGRSSPLRGERCLPPNLRSCVGRAKQKSGSTASSKSVYVWLTIHGWMTLACKKPWWGIACGCQDVYTACTWAKAIINNLLKEGIMVIRGRSCCSHTVLSIYKGRLLSLSPKATRTRTHTHTQPQREPEHPESFGAGAFGKSTPINFQSQLKYNTEW